MDYNNRIGKPRAILFYQILTVALPVNLRSLRFALVRINIGRQSYTLRLSEKRTLLSNYLRILDRSLTNTTRHRRDPPFPSMKSQARCAHRSSSLPQRSLRQLSTQSRRSSPLMTMDHQVYHDLRFLVISRLQCICQLCHQTGDLSPISPDRDVYAESPGRHIVRDRNRDRGTGIFSRTCHAIPDDESH